jgi:Zn-dependent metalloprotease
MAGGRQAEARRRGPGAAARVALIALSCLVSAGSSSSAPAASERKPTLRALDRRLANGSNPVLSPRTSDPRFAPVAGLALRRLRESARTGVEVRMRGGTGTPRQIRVRSPEPPASGQPGRARDEATAREFLHKNAALLALDDPDSELELRRYRVDRHGRTHLRFAQRHRGLPVWPGEVVVHLDRAGGVDLADGAWVPTPRSLGTEPALDAASSLALARGAMPDGGLADAEPAELIVYAPGERPPRLAWRLDLIGGLTSHWRVVIDAESGETLLAYNRVATAAATGSGQDLFGQTRALALWEAAGTYHLLDTSKALYDASSTPPSTSTTRGALIVLDAQLAPTTPFPSALPPVDRVTSTNPSSWAVSDSVSAAFNLSETYDYFQECHGRTLQGTPGANVLAVVRMGQGGAFWSSALRLMAFGNAAPYAGSLDVVGHEYMHGVIEGEADLIYSNQSGAVNEAYADVFGELAEAHAAQSNASCSDDPPPDWRVGSALGSTVRDLRDPASMLMGTSGQPYPARMSDYLPPDDPVLALFPEGDNGGVHLNSVILSRAFYQLAAGLPQAIGLDAAAGVFYDALTDHLVANSQFVDVRLAAIAVAEATWGAGSPQALAVAAAFDSVEIFDGAPTPPPPDFGAVPAEDSTVYISFAGGFFLDRRETALGDPPAGSPLSVFDVAPARPSVGGDGVEGGVGAGVEAWFVDSDDAVCVIDTNPTAAEDCAARGNPPTIPPATSVAVSPPGNFLAVVFDANPQNAITVTFRDPFEGWTQTYLLEAPAVDGQTIANILYPGAMDFTADERFLVFDALNELQLAGQGAVQVWSIYALDLADGTLQDVVPPMAGFDFAYPSLGQTNDNLLTFDAVDQITGVSTVFTANLTTGELVPVAVLPGGPGVPGYTGDDSALVYSQVGATTTDLVRRALQPDHLNPTADPPTLWLAGGDFGVVYRRGSYSGPPQDRDLDGRADGIDNCPDEPNPGQLDRGGVGPGSGSDGIGDACQCGDANKDGFVTGDDATSVRQHLVGSAPPGFALQLCSAIGGLECDLRDAAVLLRTLAGRAPGIAPVCSAAQP